ncbi:MAG: hypothetical protein GX610_07035 [Rhodococcus sp.]|nr:hypothetical protein [Rhodococcus sp. (in: high G+C Gram-positive bacteria)]
MEVDPDALRTFATSLTSITDRMAEWDIGTPFERSLAAMPGTSLGQQSVNGSQLTATALGNVCLRLLEVVDIANGTADNYQITEEDFAAALSAMDTEIRTPDR